MENINLISKDCWKHNIIINYFWKFSSRNVNIMKILLCYFRNMAEISALRGGIQENRCIIRKL